MNKPLESEDQDSGLIGRHLIAFDLKSDRDIHRISVRDGNKEYSIDVEYSGSSPTRDEMDAAKNKIMCKLGKEGQSLSIGAPVHV